MTWADLTLVASPKQAQERLGTLFSEHGFRVEWDGARGRVLAMEAGGWSFRASTSPLLEIELHSSPGMFTVVRLLNTRGGIARLAKAGFSREFLETLTMRLQMQGILRGVSVWE